MSDAQRDLLTATPIIIAFAGTLRAMVPCSTIDRHCRGAVHDAVGLIRQVRLDKFYFVVSVVVARVTR